MKKSNILIAAFTVMAAVSAVKAEDVNINFDGKTSDYGNKALMGAIVEPHPGYNMPLPPEPTLAPNMGLLPCGNVSIQPWPLPSCDGDLRQPAGYKGGGAVVNTAVYKLAAPGMQKLRKEVINMPGLSKEFIRQLNEEKTIVLYNENPEFNNEVQHLEQNLYSKCYGNKLSTALLPRA